MFILHIETSTTVCSVALSGNGQCLFFKMNDEGMNHAALLSTYIAEALEVLKPLALKPDAIAVSSGPGSYTGLRIGVSTAKGLCYGYEIPLIAVNTLSLMTIAALKVVTDTSALFCPMIDARRMEVYAAFYDNHLQLKREIQADIIDEKSYSEILSQQPVYFFGNGAGKCKNALSHSNAHFIDNIVPLACDMIEPAEKAFVAKEFADTAYFEPFYLKEFQATIAKKLF